MAAARAILFSEGFGRLTMEAVAAKSGVSKPTLYRHWANAQQLAMTALLPPEDSDAKAPGKTARARLTKHLERLIDAFATTRGRQIAIALASADPDSEYTRAFRTRVILASRDAGRDILNQAIAQGELDLPPDMDVLLDMLYGPIFFRLLVGHKPLQSGLARASISLIWKA